MDRRDHTGNAEVQVGYYVVRRAPALRYPADDEGAHGRSGRDGGFSELSPKIANVVVLGGREHAAHLRQGPHEAHLDR